MATQQITDIHELEEFYTAQVNNLVETGREELIPALTSEFDVEAEELAARAA